jgi:transposase
MNALSLDLRRRIAAAVDAGLSQSETARRFAVSRMTVVRLMVRRRDTGSLQAKPRPGARRRLEVEQQELLVAQMRAHPQASLEEHACLWQEQQGQSISGTTLWRTLGRMHWSHKKRVSKPANVTK